MNTAPWVGRAVIYRCYDADGVLLYVGSTRNVVQRIDAHRRISFWAPAVARIRIQIATDELDARRREAEIIRTENPRFNLHHRRARIEWSEQDYRDAIRALRARPQTGYTARRVKALRQELTFRLEALA